MKHLEENIGVNSHDLGLGIGFLNVSHKEWTAKEKKIDKLGFTKMKNWSASKDTIKKEKSPQKRRKYLQIIYLIVV